MITKGRTPDATFSVFFMKTALLYTSVILLFTLAILGVLQQGSGLEAVRLGPQTTVPTHLSPSTTEALFDGLKTNAGSSLSRLLLQIFTILLATQLAGRLFRKIRQPIVVGEILAGISLGPSLLGWLLPGVSGFVFPQGGLETIGLLSQVGVCLFMFLVGLDFDTKKMRGQAHAAVLISHTSIIFPFFLGVLLALWLFVPLAPAGARFTSFALFMGIAMSITAFPVLARMLAERDMTTTPLGTTALTCAAVDDVTAWSILAFITVFARGGALTTVWVQIGLLILFLALMLKVVRPYLAKWWAHRNLSTPPSGSETMFGALLFVMASALCTEILGVHALFGAFLAGVILPADEKLRQMLKLRLETVCSAFLLPLFFVITGLRTQIGLLNTLGDWSIVLVIIMLAVLGKLAGSLLAARFSGMNWLDSFRVGALMNTRGLMELVALNLGYELGILPPKLFTALVLMAIVTTMLTGPLLNWADAWENRKVRALNPV